MKSIVSNVYKDTLLQAIHNNGRQGHGILTLLVMYTKIRFCKQFTTKPSNVVAEQALLVMYTKICFCKQFTTLLVLLVVASYC